LVLRVQADQSCLLLLPSRPSRAAHVVCAKLAEGGKASGNMNASEVR
jgi:hypothetical protein